MRRVTSIMRGALFASLAAGSVAVFAQQTTPQDPAIVVIEPAPSATTDLDSMPRSAAPEPDVIVVQRGSMLTPQAAPYSQPQTSGWRHAPDVGG